MVDSLRRLSANLCITAFVGILVALLLVFIPDIAVKLAINLYGVYLIIVGMNNVFIQKDSKYDNHLFGWLTFAIGVGLLVAPLIVPLYILLFIVAVHVALFGVFSLASGIGFIRMKLYFVGALLLIVGLLQIAFVIEAATNPDIATDIMIRIAALLLGIWSSVQFVIAFLSYHSSRKIEQATGKEDDEIIDIV